MSPYNILSDIKSGRIQVKSMDSATILFFKCQRWDYNIYLFNLKSFFRCYADANYFHIDGSSTLAQP